MTTVTAGICTRPLGQILVQHGWLTSDQLDEALAEQARTGGRLGQVLVRLKMLDEVQLAEALAEQGKLPTLQLRPGMVDVNVAQRLGAEHSWNWKAIAVNEVAGVVTVAMEDPCDERTVNEIAKHLDSSVFAVHAGPRAVRTCLDHFFPKGFAKTLDLKDVLRNATPDESILRSRPSHDDERAKDETEPAIQLVRSILEDALASRASDVHVEPRPTDAAVRFRIDGQLHDRLTIPSYWLRPLLTRLKVMADLDIAQRRLPQDGRIQFEMQGQRIDLRLATSPGLRGEGAVIRILQGGRRVFGMDRLGLTPDQLATLRRISMARDGFILCTGPTGAGKTSTAYSLLNELNTPDRKLITIEDPVENELPEAFQIHVQRKHGLDFPTALRSVLRLDPDVILVGEIRDLETSRIAVQAALTGHLVISTIATTGTTETLSRLQDMGVERFLLADTIRGIVSQRLVRRICPECREPARPDRWILESMGLSPDDGPFYKGRGCGQCLNTGSTGSLALFEVLSMSPRLYQRISDGASAGSLHAEARGHGMTTLRDHGLQRARAGETTLTEVLAATAGSIHR